MIRRNRIRFGYRGGDGRQHEGISKKKGLKPERNDNEERDEITVIEVALQRALRIASSTASATASKRSEQCSFGIIFTNLGSLSP